MNRTKSILLAATALAMFAAPQVANAQSATVVFLPVAPGRNVASGTEVKSISADGRVVVGTVGATIWTDGQPEAPTSLPHNPKKISGNGLVLTGDTDDAAHRAFSWTRTDGLRFLANPTLTEYAAYVPASNMDGSILAVTGARYDPAAAQANGSLTPIGFYQAYRWTQSGGYQSLGQFGTAPTSLSNSLIWGTRSIGISGNGNVIAGDVYDILNGTTQRNGGFLWSSTGGLSRLPDLSSGGLPGSFTTVNGISRDGSTVIGGSRASDGIIQAAFWRNGAITGLGFIPGQTPSLSSGGSAALATSADGSIIVGTSVNTAWRWTAASGMQDLNIIVQNAGLALNGFVLNDAVGISDNGQIITGNSYNNTTGQALGYVFSIAQMAPTTLSTTARLLVTIRLPGITQTSIVNQTFNTQVDALLNGATVFTRTVTDPITGAGGVTALADARASLQQTSGLRRVVIGAPVLISNVTTVLGTTNSVIDIASGTTTSTAVVNTNGPATVATGNLGTCTTAATNGVNPTGCSLAGTAVTVNAGVVNDNTFTNTINSITPTTTQTVSQLITAKWQVSASAGNQFGTVHALAGVVAFDRGDRLIGQLLGMGGSGQGESANRVARVGAVMHDANGLVGEDGGLTMFGGYFGNWSNIDADARVPVASVKGSTNGFVLGLEKAIGAARVGVAVDHGTSDYTVRDATYPETLELKHTQVALFAGWQSGGFSLDGAAAYGFGTARTSLTTPTTPATGSRDVRSWSLGAQAGYTVPLGHSASVVLVGGVRHTSAKLDRFTEVGGPSPLIGLNQTVNRTRVYAGIEAQAGITLGGVTLTPRIHARYAHDRGDARGTADLVFVSTPNGPVMTAVGPGVGRTVAELGGSLDAAVLGNVHLWLGYDGSLRTGAQSHAAKAGVTVAF